jgi:hypothetical protein
LFFNFIIQYWTGGELSIIIYFDLFIWRYIAFVIRVAGFGILTSVKLTYFFSFISKMLSWSHVLQHWICFLLGCLHLMTQVVGLIDYSSWLNFFLNWLILCQFQHLILCLIEYQISWFILAWFLWGYLSLMTRE